MANYIQIKSYFIFVLKYLIPQKEISFYQDYLKICNELEKSKNKNGFKLFCFKLFLFPFILEGLHFQYLMVASLSEWEKMQNYDSVYILFKNNYINFGSSLTFFMTAKLTYIYFLFPAKANNSLLSKIVLQDNADFFLNSMQLKNQPYFTNEHICAKIKKSFQITFKIMQHFMFAFGNNIYITKTN